MFYPFIRRIIQANLSEILFIDTNRLHFQRFTFAVLLVCLDNEQNIGRGYARIIKFNRSLTAGSNQAAESKK